MRHRTPRSLASLLFMSLLLAAVPACQQANAPLGGTFGNSLGNSFTPASSTQSSLLGSSPNLGANPFNPGPTRVTPPPTGSAGTSGASLGAPVPGGFNPYLGSSSNANASPQRNPNGSFTGTANRNDGTFGQAPIGSGVAQASFVETASNVPPSQIPNLGTPFRSPERSGMRVIDLTNATSPPGYRPTPNAFPSGGAPMSAPLATSQFANRQFNAPPAPQFTPTMPVQIAAASPPSAVGPSEAGSFRPAANQAPLPRDTSFAPNPLPAPGGAALTPTASPSTEPLQWRRPGTGF